MQEGDNIVVLSGKLRDIANNAFQLGETYLEEKLVKKILRSLPMRFGAKVVAIEESKDVAKMTLDDLLRSLQAYEINLST